MPYLTLENDYLVVKTPYHIDFVAQLKTLPYSERKWDGTRKAWQVSVKHQAQVAEWIERAFGVREEITGQVQAPKPKVELLEVRYIGQCKERESRNGESIALGFCGGGWSVLLPETVLRSWFSDEAEKESEAPKTLYQVLGLANPLVSPDDLRSAYRRMARQWHPDVCHEPDAHERFIAIQNAYAVLSDDTKRAKYNIALQWMEAPRTTRSLSYTSVAANYRSPLRCGVLRVLGLRELSGLYVKRIIEWQDIVRGGQVLVTSWPKGAETFREEWIEL